MKKILLMCILFIQVGVTADSQPLWKISADWHTYVYLGPDTTIALLQSLMNDPNMLRNEYYVYYSSAARVLAYRAGDTYKDFILEKMRIFANYGSPGFDWSKCFDYQQIRGFLGDTGALAGMDSVVQFANNDDLRSHAIGHLAEAGRFNYFNLVQQFYAQQGMNGAAPVLLGDYGSDPRFRDVAGNLLAAVVQDSQNTTNVYTAALQLARFDKPRAVQLLDQRFRAATGKTRADFFWQLNDIDLDKDGQPERTLYAVPLEQDQYLRCLYLPTYGSVLNGTDTKRYLQPFYVKFVVDQMAVDSSVIVRNDYRRFLRDFVPLPPSPSTSNLVLVDSLIDLKDTLAAYGWVGDTIFVRSLDTNLTNARNHLLQGDTNNCYRQIKVFQQKVDSARYDTLHLHPDRTITREGWRFLHYNAEYILARLPVPPTQFMLTINIVSSGAVTKDPDIALYDSASTVQLTATPSSGYAFIGWSDSASGTNNPITLTMNSNKVVTATFRLNTFTITASAGANGTITPSGDVSVNYGESQAFAITPNTGYHIDSVIVDGVKTDSTTSYTFTNVTANHTIRAVFAINQYTLTINATNGTVVKSPDQPSYSHGTSVQLTATPSTGYHFVNWSDSITGATNPATIVMNSNKIVSANFTINQYTLTPSAGSNGTINPSTPVTVNYGGSQRFTFTPSTGYHTDSVLVDGVNNPDSTVGFTFINVTANHTIRVTFRINTYTLTVSATNGTVSKNPDQPTYNHGTTVQLTATAASCYHFVSWSGDLSGSTNPTTINMNSNKNVTANFAINQYIVTATAGVNGSITPSGAVVVNCGGGQTFTITPNTCYRVDSVIVNGVYRGQMSTYTFTDVRGDSSIRAVFGLNTYTITASASSNGTISPSGTVNVNCGANQTFTMTPSTGYHIDSVIVDGSYVGQQTSYTFTNVTANHTIRAVFIGYTLTILIQGQGTVTRTPNYPSYAAGTSVSLRATGGGGEGPQQQGVTPRTPGTWRFDHWEIDLTGTQNPKSIIMNNNKTVRAVFVPL